MALPQTAKITEGMSEHLRRCVELCNDCHQVCVSALGHCLSIGGRHVAEKHLRVLMDCAQICEASVDFMLRGSNFQYRVCGVCADICESCVDSCEMFSDDEQMKMCAELCQQCATACREMSLAGTV